MKDENKADEDDLDMDNIAGDVEGETSLGGSDFSISDEDMEKRQSETSDISLGDIADAMWPLEKGEIPCFDGVHHGTLFDAEVTFDRGPNGTVTPRLLIYDLMALNMESLVDFPFKDRYKAIFEHVLWPRRVEKDLIQSNGTDFHDEQGVLQRCIKMITSEDLNPGEFVPQWECPEGAEQAYDEETFKIQRKQYWPLNQMGYVLNDVVPAMPHESDGVIIQPWRAPYLAGTDGQVLKWKFPHLNSVDFKFTIPKKARNVNAAPEALVRSAIVELVDSAAQLDWDAVDQGKEERAEEVLREFKDVEIGFPKSVTAKELLEYSGKILECIWVPSERIWFFMKVRDDKDLPNSSYSYNRIKRSIEDDITGDKLVRWAENPNFMTLSKKAQKNYLRLRTSDERDDVVDAG
eukprot:CAMPEP_0197536764 /NCGR_PEP_ID=MMETSP1318-20131121/54777_1 /TAXON_ID=552666 /ORGANISM="Partenskyella glossopodia, Strain RCC365" /LENGTH=405 /DNA_ID=CAMNT_0043094741 /DNA_START=23 /DNA_END=1236 /DNA_ORIENTATION=+